MQVANDPNHPWVFSENFPWFHHRPFSVSWTNENDNNNQKIVNPTRIMLKRKQIKIPHLKRFAWDSQSNLLVPKPLRSRFYRPRFVRKSLSIPIWFFHCANWLFPRIDSRNQLALNFRQSLTCTYHKIFVFRFICCIKRFKFRFDLIFNFFPKARYKCITAKFRFWIKLFGKKIEFKMRILGSILRMQLQCFEKCQTCAKLSVFALWWSVMSSLNLR